MLWLKAFHIIFMVTWFSGLFYLPRLFVYHCRANDATTYRVHRRLGEPCARCGTPLAQVDFEEHTIFYCPACQTDGRVLKDRRLSRLLK